MSQGWSQEEATSPQGPSGHSRRKGYKERAKREKGVHTAGGSHQGQSCYMFCQGEPHATKSCHGQGGCFDALLQVPMYVIHLFFCFWLLSNIYNLEQVPHQFKNIPNKITTPTTAMKASSMMLSFDQKCGQKQGAADLSSDVVGLDPTGNNEQACPPAKKGKPSLTPNKQAAGHNLEMPCCPARKAKKQGIQCTSVFTYNIWLGNIISDNIYLETMMQIYGPTYLYDTVMTLSQCLLSTTTWMWIRMQPHMNLTSVWTKYLSHPRTSLLECQAKQTMSPGQYHLPWKRAIHFSIPKWSWSGQWFQLRKWTGQEGYERERQVQQHGTSNLLLVYGLLFVDLWDVYK